MLILSADLDEDGETIVYSILRVGQPPVDEQGLVDPTARLHALGVSDPEAAIKEARENAFAAISEESDFAAEAPIGAAESIRSWTLCMNGYHLIK